MPGGVVRAARLVRRGLFFCCLVELREKAREKLLAHRDAVSISV